MQIPRKTRCVFAIPIKHLRQHAVVIRIKIEPFLRGIARDMRQEKPGRDEKRLILGRGFDLLDGPTGDLVIALAGVVVIQWPHTPIHQRVVAHRRFTNEFLRRPGADAT